MECSYNPSAGSRWVETGNSLGMLAIQSRWHSQLQVQWNICLKNEVENNWERYLLSTFVFTHTPREYTMHAAVHTHTCIKLYREGSPSAQYEHGWGRRGPFHLEGSRQMSLWLWPADMRALHTLNSIWHCFIRTTIQVHLNNDELPRGCWVHFLLRRSVKATPSKSRSFTQLSVCSYSTLAPPPLSVVCPFLISGPQ